MRIFFLRPSRSTFGFASYTCVSTINDGSCRLRTGTNPGRTFYALEQTLVELVMTTSRNGVHPTGFKRSYAEWAL
jgi:hypothetical protein